jgi:hypothetical protein
MQVSDWLIGYPVCFAPPATKFAIHRDSNLDLIGLYADIPWDIVVGGGTRFKMVSANENVYPAGVIRNWACESPQSCSQR